MPRWAWPLLLLAGASAAADPPPLRDFARHAEFNDVVLSPGGTHVAGTVPVGGETGVAILRIQDMKVLSSVRGGQGDHAMRLRWVNEERIVFSVGRSDGALEPPQDTGKLYTLGIGEQQPRAVPAVSHVHRFLSALASDADHFLIVAERNWILQGERSSASVHRVHVRRDRGSRQKAKSPIPGPGHFVADVQGEVRYFVGNDGEDVMANRTFVREADGLGWKELGRPDRSRRIIPHRISADGRHAILDARVGRDRSCLARMSLSDGAIEPLACDETVGLGGIEFAADDVTPIAAIFEDGRPQVTWVHPDHPDARTLASLAASFPGQAVRPTSWSRDGSRAVFLVYGDRNPGEFYLFDRKSGKATFLLSRRQWIRPGDMAPMEPITFKARDGATIHGYLTLPPGRGGRKPPLVVVPHGGPIGIRDVWGWNADVQALASRGYAVLQVNFRGSGGYGHAFQEAGRQAWGTVMINDLTDAVRWTVAQARVDGKRMCIYGASYGGYAALMSAVREPDLYRCAVGYVGVYDLPRMRLLTDISRSRGGRRFIDEFLGEDEEVLEAQSPINHLDRLVAPVFIVHGEEDQRAPFDQAERLRDALEEREHPHEWMAKDDEGHGFRNEDHRTEFYERLLAFLDRHLGP